MWEWEAAYTNAASSTPSRWEWYYYTDLPFNDRLTIAVWSWYWPWNPWYYNMGSEKLLNTSGSNWNNTNMPFWRRTISNISYGWAPWWDNNINLSTNGTEWNDWASLWIR
jgi:hypothetical protein